MAAVTAVVQWLLVLALLVGHSQGQSEASITGLVDKSTLTEWGFLTTDQPNRSLRQGLNETVDRQFLFPGLRFRCSGNVTKWIVGASSLGQLIGDPALGIYRDRPVAGGGFADRVGATSFNVSIESVSNFRVYEFTPDPPLPFRTDDSLGIYIPTAGLRPFGIRVTSGPASRNYVTSNAPAGGVDSFDYARNATEETDRLPLVAVEIESDDPDSADCTRDFISRDLVELLSPFISTPSELQIVFTSSNFTGDGNITSWTVAAEWVDGVNRTTFPELQIWRRKSGDTYDRIASTELTATAESPSRVYSGMIDPPLQFQSGDLLGMYIPRSTPRSGARLEAIFGLRLGPTYEQRSITAPPSTIELTGQETGNFLNPFLALEISLVPPPPVPTQICITPPTTGSQDTGPSASAPADPSLSIPKAAGGMIGTFIGGVAVGAVTVLIIVVATGGACARKKNQNPTDRSVDAIDMSLQHDTTAVSTKQNEAYATAMSTSPNQAYASTNAGDTADYDYIV